MILPQTHKLSRLHAEGIAATRYGAHAVLQRLPSDVQHFCCFCLGVGLHAILRNGRIEDTLLPSVSIQSCHRLWRIALYGLSSASSMGLKSLAASRLTQ